MKHLLRFVSCAALMVAAFLPRVARADDFNDMTIVKFSSAVRVPGATLAAGTYKFQVLETAADRIVVKITNETESHTFATVIANRNYWGTPAAHRDDPLAPTPGKTEFAFYESPAGQPQAVKTWFYPGQSFGFEFVYDKSDR